MRATQPSSPPSAAVEVSSLYCFASSANASGSSSSCATISSASACGLSRSPVFWITCQPNSDRIGSLISPTSSRPVRP